MRIILASKSKFRKHAFDILGLKCLVKPSNFNESSIRHKNPRVLVRKLAEAKAKAIQTRSALVVAGDLFAIANGRIFEKPKTRKQAHKMIKSLSGKKMDIIGSVAVLNTETKKILSAVEKYTVKFRKLKDYEIKDYIRRYPVLKLSAALEGDGLLRFCTTSGGKYPFLTGFPMNSLIKFLRANGIKA